MAAFTNLSRDHFDYHGSETAYFNAKARLFRDLEAEWHVLNLDDPYGRALLLTSHACLLTYGLASSTTLKPHAVHHGLDGIRFVLPTSDGPLTLSSPLVGRHNIYNLLAGIGIALALGVDAEAIRQGVARLRKVPGRLERVCCGQDVTVFVDYAHTPAALEQVLRLVRAEAAGRLITVFGCGGDRDPGKRPLMGQAATALSDYTIITSDNPRTEDPQRIIDDIVRGSDRPCVELYRRPRSPPGHRTGNRHGTGAGYRRHRRQRARGLPDHRSATLPLRRPGSGACGLSQDKAIVMPTWRVADLVHWAHGALLRGDERQDVCGASTDSRTVQAGNVFVALRGERFDGHRFVPDAIQRGAAAVVVSDTDCLGKAVLDANETVPAVICVADTEKALQDLAMAHRRRFQGSVVAVTGSNGKTTVKEMTASVLQTWFSTHKTSGNLNNHIGVPLAVLGLDVFNRVMVLEMGMNHLGEISRLCEIARPDVGVITNIGLAHLGCLGSVEAIQQAKGELTASLDASGVAIVNADDPRALALGQQSAGRLITFGQTQHADVRGWVQENLGLAGTRCRVILNGTTHEFRLHVPGDAPSHERAGSSGRRHGL